MRKYLAILLLLCSCTVEKSVIDARSSYDPDGWIAGQVLEQISGAKAVIKETEKLRWEIFFNKKGVHEFRLTITDNDSAKTSKVIQEIK